MSGRCFLVCGALLVFANVAFGDGAYQRTKNGKTLVWNNHPKPGDEATWSGGRDRDGYARGFGTLTWYTVLQEPNSAKPVLYARYWGNMVRGKLNGPVNVHSKRKTNHAIFADGVRTTRWAGGPAPSRSEPDWRLAARAAGSAAGQQASFNTVASPEAPAEGPSRTGGTGAKTESAQLSALNAPPETQDNAEFSTSNSQPPTTAGDIDNSLRLLVWPPRHLRNRPVSTSSLAGANPEAAGPAANARLTKEEVVDLADAVARLRGYDLAEYQRPEPQYDPADQTWSLLYEQQPVDGTRLRQGYGAASRGQSPRGRMSAIGKHFSVAVRDKTKGTALVPGR